MRRSLDWLLIGTWLLVLGVSLLVLTVIVRLVEWAAS